LDGKLEGRAPLRRSWHRWRIILKSGVVWICLAGCCDHGNELSGVT
jgi:hypothetical protein